MMRKPVTQEYRDKISRRMKEVWWRRRMEKAMKQFEEKRKGEHCYLTYCRYLTERNCMCLCSGCAAAKAADH